MSLRVVGVSGGGVGVMGDRHFLCSWAGVLGAEMQLKDAGLIPHQMHSHTSVAAICPSKAP